MLGQYCRAGRHHSDDCIRRHRSLIRTSTDPAADHAAAPGTNHAAAAATLADADADAHAHAGIGTNHDADPGDRCVRPDGLGLTDRLGGRTAPGRPGDQPG